MWYTLHLVNYTRNSTTHTLVRIIFASARQEQHSTLLMRATTPSVDIDRTKNPSPSPTRSRKLKLDIKIHDRPLQKPDTSLEVGHHRRRRYQRLVLLPLSRSQIADDRLDRFLGSWRQTGIIPFGRSRRSRKNSRPPVPESFGEQTDRRRVIANRRRDLRIPKRTTRTIRTGQRSWDEMRSIRCWGSLSVTLFRKKMSVVGSAFFESNGVAVP